MGTLSQKTISFGISEAAYNLLTDKTAYRADVDSLSNVINANSIWYITKETFIPSDKIVNIPANVTLVPQGGFFTSTDPSSGTGKLVANKTKIKADFEQVFDENIKLTGYWDIAIAHPEWFGTIDPILISDSPIDILNENYEKIASSSKKIQKAIDLIFTNTFYVKLPKQNNVYPTLATMFYGGRVVCKPYSLYFIETAINLPLGISFDGGNSNFVYNIPTGLSESPTDILAAKYMFKININNDLNDWTVEQRGQSDTISNIRMVNNIYLSNDNQQLKYKFARGIYSGSQCCVFENIESSNFNQTFQRLASGATNHPSIGGRYIDNITLRNITINAPLIKFQDNTVTSPSYALESPYQIDTGYVGDNLMIDNVAIGYDAKNPRGIKIVACTGGVIQRITNGTIYIQNSKAITLSGVHQEIGNLIVENSQVDVNGYTHFKKAGVPCVQVIKRNDTSKVENRTISLRNFMILYTNDKNKDIVPPNPPVLPYNTYSNNEIDVDTDGKAGVIKLENVCRCLRTGSVESSSLYGIRMINTDFIKNQAANSISSIVTDQSSGLLNNHISFQLSSLNNQGLTTPLIRGNVAYIGNSSSGSDIIACNSLTYSINPPITQGIFKYYAAIIIDKERMLGFVPNFTWATAVDGARQIVSSTDKFIVMGFESYAPIGSTIRLFRQINSDTIFYIDIPVCSSGNIFFDFGAFTLFGDTWQTTGSQTLSSNSIYLPSPCTVYQNFGVNVKVTMPAYPTKGNWKRGDFINFYDPNYGDTLDVLTIDALNVI
ncbi:MAG: hypothetical protein ACOYOT_04595 [Bacteroidales bacterium]